MDTPTRTARAASAGLLVLAGALVLSRYGVERLVEVPATLARPAAWIVVLTLACWGAGEWVWRRWLPDDGWTLSTTVIALGAGAGALAAIAGGLALLHILYPAPLLVVLTLLACRGGLGLYRLRPIPPPRRPGWGWALFLAVAAVTMVSASALSPFYDQWNYHLGMPYQWLRAGTVEVFPRHVFSFFPSTMGLISVYGLAGPGGWAGQMCTWWITGLACIGAAAVARQLTTSPFVGVLTATILATTPAVFEPATVASSDLGVAAFGTVAWLVLIELRHGRLSARVAAPAAGAFAGLAAGCKYLGLANIVIPVGLLLMVVLWRGERRTGAVAAGSLAFAIGAAATFGPWAARNWVATGNPMYPFLSGILPSPIVDGVPFTPGLAETSMDFGFTASRLVEVATLGTFTPQGWAGDIGPVYLWLLAPWILWQVTIARGRSPSFLVFAGFLVGLGLTAGAWHLGRYLVPILPLAAAGMSAAWVELLGRLPRAVRLSLWSLLALVLVGNLNPNRTATVIPQVFVALDRISEGELLDRYVTCWPAYRVVNERLPKDARILLVAESRTYGIDRDIVADDPYQDPLLVDLAERASDVDELLTELRRRGITHVLVNRREAVRMARLNGREGYLRCSSVEAARRLDEALGRLVSVWSGPMVDIFAVPPGPRMSHPG